MTWRSKYGAKTGWPILLYAVARRERSALGKVKQLEERYPGLTAELRSPTGNPPGSPLEQVDILALAKASQAVSSELDLNKMIETLLIIALRGMTAYPFVPGHEVVGKIIAVGDHVTARRVGQRVGLGWFSGCCMSCSYCLSGDHNLCSDPLRSESTIVRRHGGFADRVRAHWVWVTPLPESLVYASAGPLFCGGSTVFNPIVQNNVQPTDLVGVIGIGGLGHLALAFLNKWGCEVTAFTSSDSKRDEALSIAQVLPWVYAHNRVYTSDEPI